MGLLELYGSRLKGVYLFGSHARGEQDPESDLDVLVVLDEVTHYFEEVERTSHLGAALSIKYGVSISKVFVSEHEWRASASPFLKTVQEEALPV